MDVHMGNIKTTIESNTSEPVIVKTNENQWQESEGVLLRYEAFGNSMEVTWGKFANALQRRYLSATKQDRQNPIRPLTEQDLRYLYHIKFTANSSPSKETIITVRQYDNFWTWFGPGLERIRYQRHLCELWEKGFICGFISRSEAENILENASPGAFIIRFSEQCPGQFAIAYVPFEDNSGSEWTGHYTPVNLPGQDKVKHYLMQRDDIFGAKKTLADFLGDVKNLSHIVQIIDNPLKGRIFQQWDKHKVLNDYYSSKRGSDNLFGYENKLD
jgi:hypothetical protein